MLQQTSNRALKALAFVASVSAIAVANPPSEQESHFAGQIGLDIAEVVKEFEAKGFHGALLAAVDGEVIAAVGIGFADLESERPCTPDTLFEIASVTKQFTAAAILRLVQDGRLRLDDSIARHLPEGSVPQNCEAITIEHLLRHTSGIPGSNSQGGGNDIKGVLPSFLRGGPRHEPGTHWEYWNQGYAILSEIVRRAAREEYTTYLKTTIFQPAAMRSTYFTGDTAPDAVLVAVGRSVHGAPRTALEHPYGGYGFQYRGMGGVVTSVWELWRWDRALHGNEVLDDDAKEQLFKPGLNNYALGWFVRRDARGRLVHSHGGGVRGFICEIRRYPEQDAFLAVLSNRDDAPLRSLVQSVEQVLLGDAAAGMDREHAAALVGEYTSAHGRKLKIRVAGPITRAEIHWSPGRGPVTHATIESDGDRLVFDDGADRIPLSIERDGLDPVRAVTILNETYRRLANEEPAEQIPAGPGAEERRAPLPIDPGMNAMIGTRPYQLNEFGVAHLPHGLAWTVMPRYTGVGGDGRQLVDDRITLVLHDAQNSFWPVIVRMDTDVAERLARDLQRMIEQRKRGGQ